MIISRTPFRVSFFGGGSDYPAWFRDHGGAVLATSIDKYCYISCRKLPQFFEYRHRIVYSRSETTNEVSEIRHPAVRAVLTHMKCTDGLEIHHDGDLPARSGLGSSSSFTVGMIHAIKALHGQRASREELASLAIHIEQNVIGENVGSQDQVSAAFGGFNRIEFLRNGGFVVDPVILPKSRIDALQDHLALVFTGFSRYASEIAGAQISSLASRAAEIRQMAKMVGEGIDLLCGDYPLEDFGRLLHEGWMCKRALTDLVSNPQIDAIYDSARTAGAIGGKLLGAGSGGFMLLFVPPAKRADVLASLGQLVHVPFRFENSGSRIVLYQPDGL